MLKHYEWLYELGHIYLNKIVSRIFWCGWIYSLRFSLSCWFFFFNNNIFIIMNPNRGYSCWLFVVCVCKCVCVLICLFGCVCFFDIFILHRNQSFYFDWMFEKIQSARKYSNKNFWVWNMTRFQIQSICFNFLCLFVFMFSCFFICFICRHSKIFEFIDGFYCSKCS